ncbi:Uncharacterized protein APZ42_019364 [Daphnia magna]|uniref:Uncharacterized protein n=1 Tax=Daphnia magna TaxID=35525 RepID=A0A164YIG2_9CRUS|nr:Uncharacterized protein APZ42_019364 [Daphnia magna]
MRRFTHALTTEHTPDIEHLLESLSAFSFSLSQKVITFALLWLTNKTCAQISCSRQTSFFPPPVTERALNYTNARHRRTLSALNSNGKL